MWRKTRCFPLYSLRHLLPPIGRTLTLKAKHENSISTERKGQMQESQNLRVLRVFIHVRSFVIVSQVPEALFIFFSLFSFCCSHWAVSVVLSFSLLILSFLPSILLLSPSTEFQILVIVFFSSKNSYLVLISIFYSFAETSCFFFETIFSFVSSVL